MYRILKADKDSYICNKIIQSSRPSLSSSIDSNVGQAGTIDLYKLYNETSPTSGIELSRGLVHFNLDPLRALTGSILNPSDSSFKCYLNLKNVYGGQPVPSNYTLSVFPLAKDWAEGRGNDVIAYRDLDVVNWYTASLNPSSVMWTSGGIGYGSDSSNNSADYYTFFSSSTGYVPLEFTQAFYRGDEDLNIEVTPVIKHILAGDLPDYGFRLSFTSSQETDSLTRFVKRFSTRQSRNTNLHPSLVVKYDDTFVDNQSNLYLDYANKIGTYFAPFGYPTNFQNNDGSFVSGSGSLMLELHGSQSQYVTTSSFSISHNKVISYLSASWVYFSTSFTGSQIKRGGLFETGSYYAEVYLPKSAEGLSGVLDSSGRATLTPIWKSTDGAFIFDTGAPLTFQPLASKNNIGSARNYATNITNLKDVYISTDVARLRVFVMDYDPTLTSFYLPYMSTSKIFKESYWRVIDPYTKEVLIPFDIETKGTKMSVDGEGMYFDLYMEDLPVNRPLEIEILLKDFGADYFVEKQGFLFKVIKS